jgi:exodeoxyribonuclease-5
MKDAQIDFSQQQADAIDAVEAWLKTPKAERPQVFRLFGYAGTGKTTIARHLADQQKGDVCYAAFTGKAALMMRRNGCVGASTIHSLIYTTVEQEDGSVEFVWDQESPAATASLIVIDECSMVDEELGNDLLRYGVPILVLGDPAQLPPVKSAGFFTEAEPDAMLTEIHRQAEGNPIIQLATKVRKRERLEYGNYGETRIIPRGVLTPAQVAEADQVIVGKNVTRHAYNARVRKFLGRESQMPQANDKLVCLRNDKSVGIFNGGIFVVDDVPPRRAQKGKIRMKLISEDFPNRPPFTVQVLREFFFGGVEDLDWKDLKHSQHFDYGYALTCHKAQGSQWPHVIVYDESSIFRDDARRWLYTAITRAQEKLTLVM